MSRGKPRRGAAVGLRWTGGALFYMLLSGGGDRFGTATKTVTAQTTRARGRQATLWLVGCYKRSAGVTGDGQK